MFVEVRCVGPGAVASVQVEDPAFADVDEEADIVTTPVEGKLVSTEVMKKGEVG